MNAVRQVREGVNRAWDTLAVGWRELRQRASHALTQFKPAAREGTFATPEERQAMRGSRWSLLASDVSTDDRWVEVTLEVPGLEPDDLSIEVVGDTLRVRGEKRVERDGVRGTYHVMERAYGSFLRTIALPAGVDDRRAEASYRNGVLRIRLPRSAEGRSRRVKVRRA